MILGGDIGGTKTNLALFEEDSKDFSCIHFGTFPSASYADLSLIVEEFLSKMAENERSLIKVACFAIAGPVHKGVCKATNLPWVIEAESLAKKCRIPKVYLINDLEANAYAIDILSPEQFKQLYAGQKSAEGNRAVISPGTGLGEAGLYWDGKRYHPFASEGGHAEFGPRDALQGRLSGYLCTKYQHPSYERVLSGPGIHTLFSFLVESEKREAPAWLLEEMQHTDPSTVISHHAVNHTCALCEETLRLFANILGSEAGNCALKLMATGGIYIGGGIAPRVLPFLLEPPFLQGFKDKGRLEPLLALIPIYVILDDKASLKGSARFCQFREPVRSMI